MLKVLKIANKKLRLFYGNIRLQIRDSETQPRLYEYNLKRDSPIFTVCINYWSTIIQEMKTQQSIY
jgi:hypothetical protein